MAKVTIDIDDDTLAKLQEITRKKGRGVEDSLQELIIWAVPNWFEGEYIDEEQALCGYEAAEWLMAACGGDFDAASQLIRDHMEKADTDALERFYRHGFDGLSAVYEREKR